MPDDRAAWRGLAATGIAAVAGGLSAQVHGLAGGELGGALGLSADEASWITTAGAAAEGMAVLVAAPLFAAFGPRVLVLTGALGAAASGLAGAADLPAEIALLARAAGGFCIGLLPVAMMVFALRNFTPPRRGVPLLLFAVASPLPAALAPSVAGAATLLLGGRGGFFVDLIWAGPVAGLALALLPHEAAKREVLRGLDWAGYALLAGATAVLVVVLAQGERRFWLATPFMIPLVAAAVALVALAVARLLVAPRPWLDLSLLAIPSFAVGLLEAISLRFALMLAAFAVPQAMARLQGFRLEQAGEAVIWLAAGQAVGFSIAWLWLRRAAADGRWLLGFGVAGFGTAALLGAAVDLSWGVPQFAAVMVVAGVGQGLFLTAVLRFATAEVPPAAGASAAGLFNLSRVIGQNSATAMVGAALRLREAFHSARLAQEVTPGSQAAAERLQALTGLYAGVSPDGGAAGSAALGQMAREASAQAYALAFGDVFLSLAAVLGIAAVLVPLLPLLKPASVADGGRKA